MAVGVVVLAAMLAACEPDGRELHLTIDAAPEWLAPGETRSFTATIGSVGDSSATGARVVLVAPSTLAPAGVTGTGQCTAATDAGYTLVYCPVGDLAPGVSADATFSLTGGTTVGVHPVTLKASSDRPEPHDDSTPNRIDLDVAVGTGGEVDLEVTGSRTPETFVPGSWMTSSTTVVNRGPSTATGVEVTQQFPETLEVGSASFTPADGGQPGTCSVDPGIVRCSTDDAVVRPYTAPGDRWVLDVDLKPVDTSATIVTHGASSPHPEPIPDMSPNTSTVTVQAVADHLAFSTTEPVPVGSTVDVTGEWVSAENPFAGYASHVQVVAPEGFAFVEAEISGTTYECAQPSTDCLLALHHPVLSSPFTLRFVALEAGPPASGAMNASSEVTWVAGSFTLHAYDPAITSEIHPLLHEPASGVVGKSLGITGAVHNTGATDHHDVVATITADGGLITEARWDHGQVPCTIVSSATAQCALDSVPAHSYRSFSLAVDPLAAGSLEVEVTLSSSTLQDEPDPFPDQASLEVPIAANWVDLGVVVETSQPDPVTGALFRITSRITNHGTTTATGVELEVVVPEGLDIGNAWPQYPLRDPTASCTVVSSTLARCDLGDLPAGQTQEVLIDAPPVGPVGGNLTVTATSTTVEPVPDANPNTVVRTLTLQPRASDLGVERFRWQGPIVSGLPVNLSIPVINDGPASTTDGVITVQLPEGWSVTSATVGSGACNAVGATVTCSIPVLYRGTRNVDLAIVPGAPAASAEVTVTVSAADADPDPTDNSRSETVAVHADEVDLGLSSTTSATVTAGVETSYEIRVSNAAPTPARDVVVTTTFPNDVSITSVQINPGAGNTASCATDGQVVTCSISRVGTSQAIITHRVVHLQHGAPSTAISTVTSAQVEIAGAELPNTLSFTRTPAPGDARLRVRAFNLSGTSQVSAQVRVFRSDDLTVPVITGASGSFTFHNLPHGHQYLVEVSAPGYATTWWQGATGPGSASPLHAAGISETFSIDVKLAPG